MNRTLRLAWRNLARNRRRTLLSLAIVAFGTVALVLTAGFVRASFDGLREAIIHGGLGHLEVATAEAVAKRRSSYEVPISLGIDGWQAVQAEIERVPHVAAAAPAIHFMGMAGNERGDTVSFLGVGVDPARERRADFSVKLLSGENLPDAAPDVDRDVALVARGLAESLGVGLGDTVSLVVMAPSGMTNILDARVVGIITTGMQDLDTRFLKLHVGSAARLLETERVSDLIVTLDATERTAEVEAEIARRLAGHSPALAVVDWQTRAPFHGQVKALYLQIFWFLGTVILVLVVLAASNTLVMAVYERVREIGTLRAIGTGPGQLAALLLGEALWLALIGSLVGDGLGVLLIIAINRAQIEMPPPPGAVLPIQLEVAIVPEALVGAVVLMMVVLAIAAAAPIVRALRMRIVDALGHV